MTVGLNFILRQAIDNVRLNWLQLQGQYYSKNLSLESQDELYQDKLMQISTDNLVWNAVCALHQQKLNNDLYIFLSLAPKNINTFYTEGFFIAHYA